MITVINSMFMSFFVDPRNVVPTEVAYMGGAYGRSLALLQQVVLCAPRGTFIVFFPHSTLYQVVLSDRRFYPLCFFLCINCFYFIPCVFL
jgi:hypothetical protein